MKEEKLELGIVTHRLETIALSQFFLRLREDLGINTTLLMNVSSNISIINFS